MAGTPRPLGYTLRRIGQFPADRFLANLHPRFVSSEHLLHGGVHGDCWCTRGNRRAGDP